MYIQYTFMKLKHLLVVSLILLSVITLSVVSANDNITSDELTAGEVEIITSDADDISTDNSTGTFTELREQIINTPESGTLILDKNYKKTTIHQTHKNRPPYGDRSLMEQFFCLITESEYKV